MLLNKDIEQKIINKANRLILGENIIYVAEEAIDIICADILRNTFLKFIENNPNKLIDEIIDTRGLNPNKIRNYPDIYSKLISITENHLIVQVVFLTYLSIVFKTFLGIHKIENIEDLGIKSFGLANCNIEVEILQEYYKEGLKIYSALSKKLGEINGSICSSLYSGINLYFEDNRESESFKIFCTFYSSICESLKI